MIYEILWNNDIVGHAQITKRGLYYEISCRDSIRVPHTIEMCNDSKRINLGICVPIGNEFGFCTQIPIKRIGGSSFSFHLIPITEQKEFVPIKVDEPFFYIFRLNDAYLSRRGEEVGVLFRSESKDR